jgi:hypothetical protein
MAFVQIIEFHTDDVEPIRKAGEEYEAKMADAGLVRRRVITQDRNDPTRFLLMAFFDSYESAMENSARPETNEIAEKMASLVDGPPTFHDLDVIEDVTT